MKTITKILITLVLVTTTLFVSPIPVQAAQTPPDGKVVLGGSFTLQNGETLNGSLLVIGGQATLEENSTVYGDVLITGGVLFARGTINGNVTAIGGSLNLEDSAVVQGDVNTVGSVLNKSEQAVISGSLSFDIPSDFEFNYLPALPFSDLGESRVSTPGINFKPVWDFMWAIFRAVALAALAALLSLFMQKNIEHVTNSLMAQPFSSGGLGVLTAVVVVPLMLLLIITLILSPLGIIGLIIFALSVVLGWIAVGYELGKRMATLFKQNWAPTISMSLGTLTLSLLSSLFSQIPCIGWVIPFLIAMVGLGGVALSRFGTATYNPKPPEIHPTPAETSI